MAARKRTTRSKQPPAPTARNGARVLEAFSAVPGETWRGTVGVTLFVLAVLLLLSAGGMAGTAGHSLYEGLRYLFGIGYFLLPVVLLVAAFSLFRSAEGERSVGPVRITGGVLFFISALGICGVVAPELGGVTGALFAAPLVRAFEAVASIVLLSGLFVISLLLLFDSGLWVGLWQKTLGLVRRTPKEDQHDLGIDETREPVVRVMAAEETTQPHTATARAATPTTQADDAQAADSAEAITPTLEQAPAAPKKAPLVLPSEYTPPPLSILEKDRGKANVGDTKARANIIRRTLQNFGIRVEMDEITVGPSVTRYALKPAEGVKLSKIVALQPNLEYAVAAHPIRIEAPIPGKSLVGIEVPNAGKSFVGIGGLLSAPAFSEAAAPLLFALGKDISGDLHYADIAEMPHLLIAGATKSGKSVMVHTLVTSLLYRNGPERLKLILVDPKRVELTLYDGIPHLLTPVITDAKGAILALKWAAKEMDRRYDVLREHKKRDIGEYHHTVLSPALDKIEKRKARGEDIEDAEAPESMPHIVVVIDELADIMQAYPRELEAAIVRLAQMSRAVGIHLILSTQRPSANVVTGLIKANIPARLALKVSSLLESRIILDTSGAEKLLGAGDMLFQGADMPKPRRIQSPFITSDEVRKIVAFLAKHNTYVTDGNVDLTASERGPESAGGAIPFAEMEEDEDVDSLYEEIRQFVVQNGKASTSLIQRRFKIGYGRAARIMDQLEERGVIGASDGTNKPRPVLQGGGGGATADTPVSGRAMQDDMPELLVDDEEYRDEDDPNTNYDR